MDRPVRSYEESAGTTRRVPDDRTADRRALVIAGEGAQIDLRAAGLDDGLLSRVTVPGPVSEAEKIALLDRASVLMAPSLYEGFGFGPLEAMARGCPVVVARAGALRSAVTLLFM